MEIGPYRVREEGKLEYNNGSWDEFANVLFVDNPVGTGFSYVDTNKYVHELTTMADNMVTFLEKFMGLFPEYMHDDVGARNSFCWHVCTEFEHRSTLLANPTPASIFLS